MRLVAHPMLRTHQMNVSLFQAAAAMTANSKWQELIAMNMAAGAVPGFKGQELTFAAAQAGLSSNAPGQQAFTIPKALVSTSFLQGELTPTGNLSDIAIQGTGFITVQMPGGVEGYTRGGQLHVSAQGQLVTKEGYAVLGTTGPVQLDPSSHAPLTISPSGDVSQGAERKGAIRLTDFDHPGMLTQVSGGYYTATNPNMHPTTSNATVCQGFLEGSNVSMLSEMGSLITAMRAFESNQHLIQIQDDHMGKVISELGNPS